MVIRGQLDIVKGGYYVLNKVKYPVCGDTIIYTWLLEVLWKYYCGSADLEGERRSILRRGRGRWQ